MLESEYQKYLVGVLRHLFRDCFILKNDPNFLQGLPDLLILFKEKWAVLEVKPFEGAHQQPNQEYYIRRLNDMSFAAFIYPENEEEVLQQLSAYFLPPVKLTRAKRTKTKT